MATFTSQMSTRDASLVPFGVSEVGTHKQASNHAVEAIRLGTTWSLDPQYRPSPRWPHLRP